MGLNTIEVGVAALPYRFKPHPYSSHTLLLRCLPEHGDGQRVLDAGCAGGYLAEILASRGYTVTGIEKARQADTCRGFEYIEADLDEGLPRLDGAFDYVICADVLEHLRDPELLLRDIRQVLRPGGLLIASLPNSGHIWFRLNVLLGRFPADERGLFDRTHLHFYMWRGWLDLLSRAGFRVTAVTPAGTPVGLALPRWEGAWLIRLFESISFGLARLWKTLFAYQFILVARLD